MDPSTKLVSLFLLLALFSTKILGRESYFFSKVTHGDNNNFQETTVPNKEEQSLNKQVQDPAFYPETQNGYGLYGHESSELPTTTTTNDNNNNLPYKTQTQSQTQHTYTANNNYYSKDSEYNNDVAFEEQQQNFGGRYTTTTNQYNSAGGYSNNDERQGKQRANNYYNGANGYNSAERQGMSDTRFLENGKYFNDIKGESNYYPNQHQNSRYSYNGRSGYNGNYPNGQNQYKNARYNDDNYQDDFEESQEEQYEP